MHRRSRADRRTLKDAIERGDARLGGHERRRTRYYLIGSVMGPHPYPRMVRDFQASDRPRGTRADALTSKVRLPDVAILACVGGGSNAIGHLPSRSSSDESSVALIGVEPGGRSARLQAQARVRRSTHGVPGDASTASLHPTSYPGRRRPDHAPAHSMLRRPRLPRRRARAFAHLEGDRPRRPIARSSTTTEALEAFQHPLAEREGIIPALETAHAIAEAITEARRMSPEQILVINCSGRGDKDVQEASRLLEQSSR